MTAIYINVVNVNIVVSMLIPFRCDRGMQNRMYALL